MTEKKRRTVVRTRSPHHRVVCANNIALTFSGQDVRIRFGLIEQGSAERLDVEDQVDVIIGPIEFNKLLQLMHRNSNLFNVVVETVSPSAPEAPAQKPDEEAKKD